MEGLNKSIQENFENNSILTIKSAEVHENQQTLLNKRKKSTTNLKIPDMNVDITDHLEHDAKLSDESEIKDTFTLNEIYLDLTSELLQKWIKSETNKRKNANKNSDDKCILTGAWAFFKNMNTTWRQMKDKAKLQYPSIIDDEVLFRFYCRFSEELYQAKWIEGDVVPWILKQIYLHKGNVYNSFSIDFDIQKWNELLESKRACSCKNTTKTFSEDQMLNVRIVNNIYL